MPATALILFILFSLASLLISDAPMRVHAIDISGLFIGYVLPALLTTQRPVRQALVIWLSGAIIALLFLDIGLAWAISKRAPFTGWHLLYPGGILAFILLQFVTRTIDKQRCSQ